MSIVVPPILGVTGTDVAPMVKHVPAKGQGFIHSHTNQFFIAGCEAFHSFSLQYPWAFGSVERLHLRNRIQIKARFICLFNAASNGNTSFGTVLTPRVATIISVFI